MNQEKWFSKNNYDTLTATVLVMAGVLLAFISYYMTAAVDEADILDGEIQQQTIRASTTLATGQLTADYAYNQVFRLWQELDAVTVNAENFEETNRADRYADIRDSLIDLSLLLQTPYWDIDAYFEDPVNSPDIRKFEVDTYIEQFEKERQYVLRTTEIKNYWRSTSGDYLLLTRIIAIGLTLIGISKTVMNSLNAKFLVTIVIGIVVVWAGFRTYSVWITEPPVLSDEVIDAYARGQGFFHQYLFQDAIDAYTEAIEADGTYIDARERRGFTYRELFVDKVLLGEERDLSLIEAGIQDLQTVVDNGSTARHVVSQLSEMYFLVGNYDSARQTSQYGIDTTDDFMHYFDVGLVEIAEGNIDTARDAYNQGMERARTEYSEMVERLGAPSPDFFFSMNLAITELDDLLLCIQQDFCDETPSRDQLADNEDVLAANAEIATDLKELTLAFESNNGEVPDGTPATLSDLNIYNIDNPDNTGPFDWFETIVVTAEFDYENMPDDAVIVVKVFLGTNEYLPMRQTFIWDEGESGTSQVDFFIGREVGDFEIQMFVDGSLVQEGRFTVFR